MIKIGNVSLGDVPRIALVLGDVENGVKVKEAKAKGVDILELRLDRFRSIRKGHVIKTITSIKDKGLPIIATIRSKEEGGERYIQEPKKLELFDVIIPLVDAVDIELKSKSILNKVIKKAHNNKKIVIVSYHNLKETPANNILEDIIKKAESQGGDIIKIATFARNREDVIRLMKITLKYRNKNIITLSMGSEGKISRVFFPYIGSLLTYGYVDIPSAPGQLPVDILRKGLRLFYPKL